MTLTDQDLGRMVHTALSVPGAVDRIQNPSVRNLVTHLQEEVQATETPSGILSNSVQTVDAAIRRRLVSQRLTSAAVAAANFGREEEAKRVSGSKNPRPQQG